MSPPEKGKTKIPLKSLLGQSAQSLFPDLFQNKPAEVKPTPIKTKAKHHKVIVPPPEFYANVTEQHTIIVQPPEFYANVTEQHKKEKPYQVIAHPPPNTNWLADVASDQADDVPFALLVLGKKAQPELVGHKLAKMGYAVTTVSSAKHALERLGSKKYRLVICRADAAFEEVRRFVDRLTADQRRFTYFVLVGTDLRTLYDAEALALSANLVINERDLPSLELILRKGLYDYEQLFRPLLDIFDSTSYLK